MGHGHYMLQLQSLLNWLFSPRILFTKSLTKTYNIFQNNIHLFTMLIIALTDNESHRYFLWSQTPLKMLGRFTYFSVIQRVWNSQSLILE